MNELMVRNETKISPWEKPGGKLGLVVAGIATAGGLVLLYNILPFLITLTTNMLTLTLLVLALAAIAFLITDKRFRKTFSMVYFLVMRKITGLIIEIDPIAIVEQKVKEMKQKIGDIQTQLGKVRGLITNQKRRLNEKESELKHQFDLLQEYKKKGKNDHARVTERQVVRLTDDVNRQKQRVAESEKWLEILKELKERAELVALDTENEVNERKDEYEEVKARHKAFSSIMSIIKGDPDDLEDFTRAMDFMAYDITQRLGQMSDIIDETGGVLMQGEIEDGVASKRASELLDLYEKHGIEALFNGGGTEGYRQHQQSIESKVWDAVDVQQGEEVLVPRENPNLPKYAQKNYFGN